MSATSQTISGVQSTVVTRIDSIDFLRGVVMVLMALDHARTFLNADFNRFNAEDLTQTTAALFYTRWVTHFCAPVFIFLVGTSTYLLREKVRSRREVFNFLVTRGALLIVLELTLFRLCWQHGGGFFQPFIMLLVIWAIGISMIFLAFLQYLPYRVILGFGVVVLLFHNLLAEVSVPGGSAMATVWAFLYSGGIGKLPGGIGVYFLYPVLPYFGLVALGFCLGYLYTPSFPVSLRQRTLTVLGACAVTAFVVLRYFNIYGDPRPWQKMPSVAFSVMSFLKTTKYPVSLLYCLMTIGPSLIVLAIVEPLKNSVIHFFVVLGRVPMFYYILHLVLFVTIGAIVGYNRYDLVATYGFFIFAVLVLYISCSWYARYKRQHPEKAWLKYL